MKKLFGLFFTLLLFASPAFSADQWDTTDPAGTSLAADLDTNIIANNEALDRVLIRYRRGLGINYSTAAALSVLAGEIAIPDSSDGTVRWRRTTTTTSVAWADIDTGAEASSTQYYIYATADTDITGIVFKISASSSAPSGMTYYTKIGEFYNNSSGNIEKVVSYRPDNGTKYEDTVKGWVSFDGDPVTINDSYNVSSITDNGAGHYGINWTTAFANAYYAVSITDDVANNRVSSLTTTTANIDTANSSWSTFTDCGLCTVIAAGEQ